ncbi:SwmB domain-containing protein [Sporosarcina koreensis]|uniref:SwmB domain-containing protein n=1 Tax=Sporosarcina koreensis TaxID=334735 RepID=UPI00058D5AEC|nr:SwmB domain-containing protein [Sporosarcina koreensis]
MTKKPFKVLSASALAAVMASSAIIPVASAATPKADYKVDQFVVTVNGQNLSLTNSQFNSAFDSDLVKSSDVTLLKSTDGEYYTIASFNAALDNAANTTEAFALLAQSDKQVKNANVVEGTIVDGKIVPATPAAGELKVESVSAINSTKIQVNFTGKVDKESAENLDNYYAALTDADVENSLGALNPVVTTEGVPVTEGYKATLSKDGKSVTIEATYPSHVIWADKNAEATADALVIDNEGNTVVKGKTTKLQVRNVKTADGKLLDTQESSFVAKDEVAATLYGTDKDGNIKSNNVTDFGVTGDGDVVFKFNEPVDIDGAEFYLDSKNVTANVTLNTAGDNTELTIANAAGLGDLALGQFAFEAVGVHDLAGNAVSGNIQTAIVNVVDPQEATEDYVAPAVTNIDQTEEGKFVVKFAAAPKADTKVVVKNSEGNTVYSGTADAATSTTVDVSTDIEYGTSTEILYTVEVTGADGGKIEAAAAENTKKANKFTKVQKFVKDLTAPVVVKETKNTDEDGKTTITKTKFTDGTKLVIPFYDGPFDSDVLATPDTATKDIVLKLTVGEETKTLTIPKADIGTIADNKATIDIATLGTVDSAGGINADVAAAAEAFLNEAGDALLAGDYVLTLPKGIVSDQAEAAGKKLVGNETVNPFAGDTVNFSVSKDEEEGIAPSVPQTAQGLVTFDENEEAIVVGFKGKDIDAKTAKNPANYTFAGVPLASNTKIEYETVKDGTEVVGGVARIYLNEDTVKRDGNYSLTVANVATTGGAKMLPTAVTVNGLKDNTLPVLSTAVITGNAKIELTFSESIDITDATKAAGNFEVLVNGAKYNASTTAVSDTNDKVVILTLNDTIDYAGKTVQLRTKLDQNGDRFLTDLGGNPLKANTVVTATVKK